MIKGTDFDNIKWNDISIQKINDHDKLLVLICEDKEQSMELYKIIMKHPYDVKLYFSNIKELIIRLDFIETDFYIELNTNRIEDDYYPIGWLKTGIVNYITTGIWLTDNHTDMFEPFLIMSNPKKSLN